MSRLALTAAAGAAGGKYTDEFFENTVLLLHGDGNQGATNFSNSGDPSYLAFKDNSDNNFPITVNGDAYGDNFGPYALDDGNWSNYFDGSGDYLTTPNGSDFAFGTGDFTIECWVYWSYTQYNGIISTSTNTQNSGSWLIGYSNTANFLGFCYDIPGFNFVGADFSSYHNQWTHIAVSRSGTSLKIFFNGTEVDSTTNSTDFNYTSNNVKIGQRWTNQDAYSTVGFLSNLRVVKGTAVYTTAFTPPTSSLTSISGTSLLTCQSNRFKDNSDNNFALTPAGNAAVKVFNPFGVLPDGVNGSGFFDGTTDYVYLDGGTPLTFGTGNFTIECWVYMTSTPAARYVFDFRPNGSEPNAPWCFVDSGQVVFGFAGSRITDTGAFTIKANAWYHLAFVRNSGTFKLYVDGVEKGSVSNSTDATVGTSRPLIGAAGSLTGVNAFPGYISNFRAVKGTAVYTTAFTPPASPLTAVSGTGVLTCQYAGTVRNVGFIDSGPHDFPITRAGNTTQGTFTPFSKPEGKWGVYFDGSGDRISAPVNSTDLYVSNNDFTLEAFFYPSTSLGGTRVLLIGQADYASAAGSSYAMFIGPGDPNNEVYIGGTGYGVAAPDPIAGQWNHLALVRTGGTLSYFLNGSRYSTRDDLSTGSINNGSTNPFTIGNYSNGAVTSLDGYVSQVRLIVGSGGYDATQTTLTVPTSALTATANTKLLTCQSNRFIDNSASPKTLTLADNPKVTPFSPFPLTTAYSPSVNGGAGYFDGSGDKLQSASNAALALGSNDFSIEWWEYRTAVNAEETPISTGDYSGAYASILLGYGATVGGVSTTGSSWNVFSFGAYVDPVVAGTWNHFVYTRSGTAFRVFMNGKLSNYTTASGSVVQNNNQWNIGSGGSGALDTTGYIGDTRVCIGAIPTAYQTSSTTTGTQIFSVPTSPLTTSSQGASNVVLLCNFTNAGILDNTGCNALETVGNAQIDTTTKQFGIGSLKFDGTGDALVGRPWPEFNFGTKNFTVEFWLYLSVTPSAQTWAMSFGPNGSGGVSRGWGIRLHDGTTGGLSFGYQNSGTVVNRFGNLPSATTWAHVAFCRDSTVMRCFVDGVQLGSDWTLPYSSIDNTISTDYYGIGGFDNSNNGYPGRYWFNGLIDDLRITKGIARYTTTFDPPIKAFPNIGE